MTQDRPADPNSPGSSCASRSIAPARLRHFSENRYIRMIIAGRTGNGTRTAPSIPGESASDGNRSATERPARFPASHETEPNEPKTAKFRTDRRQAQPRARAGHDAGRDVARKKTVLRSPAQRILADHGTAVRPGTARRLRVAESHAARRGHRAVGRLRRVRAGRKPRQQHLPREAEPHRRTAAQLSLDPRDRFQRTGRRTTVQETLRPARLGIRSADPAFDQPRPCRRVR